MSILLGDIERARAAHDVQRHLDLDLEEGLEHGQEQERHADEGRLESQPLGSGSDGTGTGIGNGVPLRSAYILDFREGAVRKKRYVSPVEFGAALRRPLGTEGARREGLLLVLRGLPEEYVNAIGDSAGDVDPSFIEAHAERRCYRPRGVWKGHSDFEHWEYPELVQGFDPAVAVNLQVKGDMMVSQKICSVGKGGLAAVFCRVSVWTGSYTPILFLDRPIWKDSGSSLRKAQRNVCVVSQGECCAAAAAGSPKEGDTILSLESTLRTLDLGSADSLRFPRNILLEELVFDLWLELFEVLAPPRRGASLTSCLWQMLHSLELNEDAASYNARRRQKRGEMRFSTSEDWSILLARVHRRSTLLSSSPLTKMPGLTPSSTLITNTSTRTPGGTRKVNVTGTPGANGSLPPIKTPGRSGRELLDENHRALDRISYLGGILLPLPIVSSVLSMNDAYGPDGDKFFIFWAVSLPLSAVAVMVIYADTIRKAEVWVEVTAAEHVGVSPASAEAKAVVDADEKRSIGSLWQRITRRTAEKQDEEAQGPPQRADDHGQARVGLPISGAPPLAAPPAVEEKLDEQISDFEDGQEETLVQLPMLFSLGPGLYAAEEEEPPEMIMEPFLDGRRRRAWQRKKLGWGGAMRAIVSHRKPRYCHEHSPEDLVAHEAHERAEKEKGQRRA
ncbi:hypothetical protein B0T14DRAFT_561981 [Immersiella caudata]|uniref:Uncharacterized protein n=1 Tax=Immersiella caudata TaxID=314043 RepID=A0AA40C5C2_9PEZI|nr:hypothetical protein B0T14DRAFT_561981 [Immersiella caudata]